VIYRSAAALSSKRPAIENLVPNCLCLILWSQTRIRTVQDCAEHALAGYRSISRGTEQYSWCDWASGGGGKRDTLETVFPLAYQILDRYWTKQLREAVRQLSMQELRIWCVVTIFSLAADRFLSRFGRRVRSRVNIYKGLPCSFINTVAGARYWDISDLLSWPRRSSTLSHCHMKFGGSRSKAKIVGLRRLSSSGVGGG
jgi:hypothetical protein